MVRKRGFEPLRYCYRQPLKLVRLPFRHFRVRGNPGYSVHIGWFVCKYDSVISGLFTTLHNRLAKSLQPSIWQTLELDKRCQEQGRGQRTRLCALYLDRPARAGSLR